MPNYTVTLSAKITQYVEVEADSEDEAKEKANAISTNWMDIDATKFELDDFEIEGVEED